VTAVLLNGVVTFTVKHIVLYVNFIVTFHPVGYFSRSNLHRTFSPLAVVNRILVGRGFLVLKEYEMTPAPSRRILQLH